MSALAYCELEALELTSNETNLENLMFFSFWEIVALLVSENLLCSLWNSFDSIFLLGRQLDSLLLSFWKRADGFGKFIAVTCSLDYWSSCSSEVSMAVIGWNCKKLPLFDFDFSCCEIYCSLED